MTVPQVVCAPVDCICSLYLKFVSVVFTCSLYQLVWWVVLTRRFCRSFARAEREAVAEGDRNGVENGDPPIVSSQAIYDAITSKKPKTRYLVGKLHKTIYLFTAILSDRYMDKLLTSGLIEYLDFCIFSSHCL